MNKRIDGFLELNVDPIHWAVVDAVKELYQKGLAESDEKARRLNEKEALISELRFEIFQSRLKMPRSRTIFAVRILRQVLATRVWLFVAKDFAA